MGEAETNGADVDVTVAGQSVKLKNIKSVNTIVTLLSFALLAVCAYFLWNHATDTKEAAKDLSVAMKEMAQAAREQTCIMRFEQHERKNQADFCRQISR